MKAYKKIPLIFVLLLTVFINLSAAVSPEEKAALVALYNSTDGDNWTNNSNWKSGDPCLNSWHGVTCTIGNITRLDLGSNQLTGTIPVEIGKLTSLEFLYLSHNQLTGTIPVEIGKLTSLERLFLNNNQLASTIPVEIGKLTSLTRLDLYDNQLTGTIPVEIGKLTSLEDLYLNRNQLAGTIPVEIGKLTSLKFLSLDNNYLSGEMPSSIKQTALVDNYGLTLITNCNLYSDDITVQDFIVSKMYNITYEKFLETQGHCITLAPVIMYLLD